MFRKKKESENSFFDEAQKQIDLVKNGKKGCIMFFLKDEGDGEMNAQTMVHGVSRHKAIVSVGEFMKENIAQEIGEGKITDAIKAGLGVREKERGGECCKGGKEKEAADEKKR